MLTDDHVCDVLVGEAGQADHSLPAAPAGRLRGGRANDVPNHRVQTVRTDQQISLRPAAIFELEPNSVVRADHPDRTGIAPDAVGRKAFQQPFKQDSTWDHPHWCAQSVRDRCQVHSGDRATRWCHDPQGGEQLTRPIHIDPELPQNRCAIGPDGDGPATLP